MSSRHNPLLHGQHHAMHDSQTKKVVETVTGTVVGTTFAAGATTGELTLVGATGTSTTLATGIGTEAGAVASVFPAIASGLAITAQVGVVVSAASVLLARVAIVGLVRFAIYKSFPSFF